MQLQKFKALLELFQPNIESLDLQDSDLTELTVEQWAEIASKIAIYPELEELVLSSNNLERLSPECCEALGKVLEASQSIKNISFEDNDLSEMSPQSFEKFCEALTKCIQRLKNINLTSTYLTLMPEEQLLKLGMVLEQAQELESFQYLDVEMTEERFTKVWNVFAKCPSLKFIDLGGLVPEELSHDQLNLLFTTLQRWTATLINVSLPHSLLENIGLENCDRLAEIFASRVSEHEMPFGFEVYELDEFSSELTDFFLESNIEFLSLVDSDNIGPTIEQEKTIIDFLKNPDCKVTKTNFEPWSSTSSDGLRCMENAFLAKPMLTMLSARVIHHNRYNLVDAPIRKLPTDLIRLVGAQLAKLSI